MILNVEGISFNYPGNPVFDNVHFTSNKKEFVAVLGTNGTGKTTLLKCINHILPPTKGCVLIEEKSTKSHSRNELARKMSYVEQHKVGNRMTVFNAVLLGRKPYIRWNATDEDIDITEESIRKLELKKYEMKYLDELSGGEFQKVIIARALAQKPQIMLMDEPTNHLDLKNQLDVLSIVKKAVVEDNITAIVAMHDINLALRYADRFILMKGKGIFAVGGREVITPKNIEAVYSVPVNIMKCDGYEVIVPK